MNKQSNTYTIIYIILLVVVVGTALAATSLALRPRQILAAAMISPEKGNVVADFDRYITSQFVVDERGEKLDNVKAFDVDVASQSKLAPDRRELPVYVCTTADGSQKYILRDLVPRSKSLLSAISLPASRYSRTVVSGRLPW